MEHLQHFGLNLDPFQIEPDLRFYYDSARHRDAQRRVERGLRQSKGLTVFTGEGGTGKSLLARRLLGGLEDELFEAALMVMLPGAAEGRSVVSRFAKHLEVEDLSDEPSQAMGQVYEQLAIVREDGRHSVLILDDAHLLSKQALAEVGSLLSLEYEERRLVSILLVGLQDLDVSVAEDRSLGQRVDIRVHLTSLDLEDSRAYLANRLHVAGGDPAILPEEAMETLFKHGRGRPRLMNTLADNALFEAYLAGRQQVAGFDVERAAGDLGIGLEPGSTYSQASTSAVSPGASAYGGDSAPALIEAPIQAPPSEAAAGQTPFEAPSQAPITDAAEADEDLDLASMLASGQPEMQELEADLPGEELSLEMEVGDESQDFEFAGGAQETQLLLGDDSQAALADDVPAIELGEVIASDDEFELPDDDPVLDLDVEGEEAPDLELGDIAEATGLMLPGEEGELDADSVELVNSANTADSPDSGKSADHSADNDEIEALFDKLLDD